MKKIIFMICILSLTIFFNETNAREGYVNCWNEIDRLGNIIVKCGGEYYDEDEDFGVSGQYFCPVCQKKGLKSRVYYKYSTRTLMGWETYWDEEGNYHNEDPNYTTSYFRCSLGHEWHEINYGTGKTSFAQITKNTEDEPEKIIEYDIEGKSTTSIPWDPEFDSMIDWSEEEKAKQLKELEKWKKEALKDIYDRLGYIEKFIRELLKMIGVHTPGLEFYKDTEEAIE
ncbi:MAG: hypothetical protein KAW56_07855 [Candidatus Marinimicrobia bacterium]|nr:hypothetical protein [Candidatus Neomarinimicrobiota bacterium]